jgi:hypothetical protein
MHTETKTTTQLFTYALWLAIFTVGYNFIEGLVSVYFGMEDEALTLFGFGLDSFIETISALGIVNMTYRHRKDITLERSRFEILALKITGWSFYALSISLVAGAVIGIIEQKAPETTIPGIIIGSISIFSMWLLVKLKKDVGRKLGSDAIIADANCNLVCVYMSFILLASSLLFEFTGIAYFDIIGAVGLVWFSIKEGKEAFEKAEGKECSCHD